MEILELKNIDKNYGDNQVLKNFNLIIDKKEFLVIVGPSGCGKSTLLRLIDNLEKPNAGNITLNNKKLTQSDTAMVFQNYALFPCMKVKDNIGFGISHIKLDKKEKLQQIIEISKILKIEHLLNRYPNQLSGGEKQRVAIARALIRKPKIFLLDEPLSNVDANLKNELINEIKELYKKNNSLFIYVTHDQEEALKLATKILIMKQGKIIQYGTKEEIINNPTSKFVTEFFSSLNPNFLKGKIINKSNKFYINYNNQLLLLDKNNYNYQTIKNFENKEIEFCFLSNNVILNNNGNFNLNINYIEDLGIKKMIHANLNNQEILIPYKEGIYKTFDIEKFILFNLENQKNINYNK